MTSKPRKLHEATVTPKPALLPSHSSRQGSADWVHEERCRAGEDTGIPDDVSVRQADGDYWAQAGRQTKGFFSRPAKPNTFPFGKHKGQPIRRIPTHYLNWLLTLPNPLDEELTHAIQDELLRRDSPMKKATP